MPFAQGGLLKVQRSFFEPLNPTTFVINSQDPLQYRHTPAVQKLLHPFILRSFPVHFILTTFTLTAFTIGGKPVWISPTRGSRQLLWKSPAPPGRLRCLPHLRLVSTPSKAAAATAIILADATRSLISTYSSVWCANARGPGPYTIHWLSPAFLTTYF